MHIRLDIQDNTAKAIIAGGFRPGLRGRGGEQTLYLLSYMWEGGL